MNLIAALLWVLPSVALHGTVRAEGSREPVASATVRIVELERAARADDHGYFVLTGVRPGRWTVRVSAPGYRESVREVQVPDAGSVRLDFELPPQPLPVPGIEVRARESSPTTVEAGPGAARLDRELVRAVPALAEVDVLRAVQALPAVAAASDFSSALYVRGGSPDQTLLLLDGVPLFNPFHLGGIFGAVDPDAVASVDLLAGAFPARVGDRLSGVVDIRTRTGGRDRVRGNGSVGLISSRGGVDGPLPDGRGSYLFSVRRTYLDLFTDAAHGLGVIPYTVPYAFTDAHLKVTHDVGRLGSVTASVYVDDERLRVPRSMDVSDDVDWAWGSRAAALGYRQPFGAALLGEFRLAVSSFGGSFRMQPRISGTPGGPEPARSLDARTGIRDVIAGTDLSWYRGRHQLRAGAQLDAYLFDYDVAVAQEDLREYFPSFARRDRPCTLAVYAEDEWTPTGALRLRAGVRVLQGSGTGTEWMPRVGARLALSPRLSLSLGTGRYAQALYSMKDEESVFASLLAYDFLAAVPGAAGLSAGRDVVAGAEWTSGTTSVRADAYLKELDRVPLPPLAAEPLLAPVLVPEGARSGRGTARGVEVLARHGWGNSGVSLAYALAFAGRTVEGERFAPRFERRNRLDLLAYTPVRKHGQASARVIWATGQPYTPAVGRMQGNRYDPRTGGLLPGGEVTLFGEHNSARLPGYFRLDLALRGRLERRWFGRSTTLAPYLQVLNALNTRNVLFAEPDPYGGRARPELEFAPQLPFLPTVGVEWRF